MDVTNPEEKRRKARRMHGAREKAAAVLSVWSGRRNPSRVCRDLGVSWGIVNSWEKKALCGMLKALGGETLSSSPPEHLGRRLEGLLAGLQPEAVPPPQTPAASSPPAAESGAVSVTTPA
jgi:transposase-like protein